MRNLMVPVVAVALSVTACGGDESSSGDEAPGNGGESSADDSGGGEDADDSAAADDADEDSESADDGSGGGGDSGVFEVMANAVIEAGSFEFETSVVEAGQEATVTGAMQLGSDGSGTNMRMTMEQGGVESSILMVDGQLYIEMTEEMGMPASEGSWMTFGDEGDSQGMAGAFSEIEDAADATDEFMENAEHLTVNEIGSATVDGVETTEYEVVDAEGATEMGDSTMWIDGDNLLRRMVQETPNGEPVEITYRNYGVDVEIEAPPEDEVVDFNEMMNQ